MSRLLAGGTQARCAGAKAEVRLKKGNRHRREEESDDVSPKPDSNHAQGRDWGHLLSLIQWALAVYGLYAIANKEVAGKILFFKKLPGASG